MHQQIELGGIGAVLENAINGSRGLELKPSPPAMRFVGFKVDAVQEGRLTADIRGLTVSEYGKTRIVSWQSGVAIVAPDDIAHDAPASTILRAARFYRWILDPGRLVHFRADENARYKAFGGLKLNDRLGFTMPAIVPTCRVKMTCQAETCGQDSFFTWSAMLYRSQYRERRNAALIREGKKPKRIPPELPRLHCRVCGVKLSSLELRHQRLLSGDDAGYTSVEHPDLQGFAAAYLQDEPVIGGLFPRLWAVYDAHMTPDMWKPEDGDKLAQEIQNRFAAIGKAVRPLQSMVDSGGQPEPKSFVIEAGTAMRYCWMEEPEIYSATCTGLDYRKRLIVKPTPHVQRSAASESEEHVVV